MQIHPAITALRDDKEAQAKMQRQFQEAISQWHGCDWAQSVSQDLSAFGDGAPFEDCPALFDLLSDPSFAREFVEIWQKGMVAALREYPLATPTFGHTSADGLTNIALMASANASLSIVAYEEHGKAPLPSSAIFADRETHECVLSGSAEGLLHEVRQSDGHDTLIDTCTAYWREGTIIVTKGPCEARQVVFIEGAMVLLRLSRRPAQPLATREYSLSDGELIQCASGDEVASQKIMSLTVLGAIAKRGEAPEVLDAVENSASDWDEDADVRWEAVRQLLALDAGRGIALLKLLSDRENDPIAIQAQHLHFALKADLLEQPEQFGSAA